MSDDNKFDINEHNEQMRRNQEAANFWMMREQTEALNKLSGKQTESSGSGSRLGWKFWTILFAIALPLGYFLIPIVFRPR